MEDKKVNRVIFELTNNWYSKCINFGINFCIEKWTKFDYLTYTEYYILISFLFWQLCIGFKGKEKME